MGGDSTPGGLTPNGSKAPMLCPEPASISLAVQGAADVKEAFWIVAMQPQNDCSDHFGPDNDYFVSSTNDPSSDVGRWINEWDAEQQYSNWNNKLYSFMRRIEDLQWFNLDIRSLIGCVTLDWCEGTHDICLSALRSLHINQWISEAEWMPPHPHHPRLTELDCLEYENFAHTARQLRELCSRSHMLDAIPNQHYAQFLTNISYRLLQKVCSLAPQFASPHPVHIYQKIGMVILNYLGDLRSDWFSGAHQLSDSFRQWQLPVEPSPPVAIPRTPTQRAVTARFEHSPEAYFMQGGIHRKKANRLMRMRGKREPRDDYHKRIKAVEEGRKWLKNWKAWRPSEEAAEKEARCTDPLFAYTDFEG